MNDDREVILERFVVKTGKGKWHYLALNSQFLTACGVYVPPAPKECNITDSEISHDGDEMCPNCVNKIDKHDADGRKIRLAHPSEGRGDALCN